jgi:hypothetical protein
LIDGFSSREDNVCRHDRSPSLLIASGFAVSRVDSSGLVPRRAPALVLTKRNGAPEPLRTPRRIPTICISQSFPLPKVDLAFPGSRQGDRRPVFSRFRGRPRRPNHLCLWLLAAAFLFHKSTLTVLDRYVQHIFTIRLIALECQYGIAASQIFRGHRRRGKLPARGATVECGSDGSVHADSGPGSRTGVEAF